MDSIESNSIDNATPSQWDSMRYLVGEPLVKNGRVILLNGPPHVGKDTIGNLLHEAGLGTLCRFKDELFRLALSISQISKPAWFARYNDRELKEKPWDLLGGLSQREFLIRISEDWIKPTFGERYFGDAAARYARINTQSIFTDSGFVSETQSLIDADLDVYIFRLYREGYDFGGDSRAYLPDGLTYNTYDIYLTDNEPSWAVEMIKEYL